jgi:hypothetical protein
VLLCGVDVGTVWVDTLLTTSQMRTALLAAVLVTGDSKDDGDVGVDRLQIGSILQVGPERLILQSCNEPEMFAVDLLTARVEPVQHAFGQSYWTGWMWRDVPNADGLIICTDHQTVAFNARTGASQRVCDAPALGSAQMHVMGDGTILHVEAGALSRIERGSGQHTPICRMPDRSQTFIGDDARSRRVFTSDGRSPQSLFEADLSTGATRSVAIPIELPSNVYGEFFPPSGEVLFYWREMGLIALHPATGALRLLATPQEVGIPERVAGTLLHADRDPARDRVFLSSFDTGRTVVVLSGLAP